MNGNQEYNMCDDCSSMDLAESLKKAYHFFQTTTKKSSFNHSRYHGSDYYYVERESFHICAFLNRLSDNTECRLCSFFRCMRLQPHRYEKYKLLAFCSSSIFFLNKSRMKKRRAWEEITHGVYIAVVPDLDCMDPNEYDISWLSHDIRRYGTIHFITPGVEAADLNAIFRPRRVGEMADLSLISGWLSFCKEHHGDRCAPQKSNGRILHGFRVINCKATPPNLEIRPFTDKYVALSYVWGPGPPEAWPRVVLDAVTITLSVGLQYLWVDRLCIDQNKPEEKHYLISKMAWIYECAEFTIVAAAGSDASYGLPGAGSTKRAAGTQPQVQVSPNLHLLSSLSDPRIIVKESVWSTRGWTYQEGVLSNRRLVFTDQQVYFECRGMAVQESLDLPLLLFHEESGKKMESFVRSGIFRGSGEANYTAIDSTWGFIDDDSPELYHSILRLDDHICTFTAKNLSYDEDSLLAFEGISERFWSSNGLGMLLGIPIWNKGFAGSGPSILHSFALGISFWLHTDGQFIKDLSSGIAAVRRKHLPSWTWAGWKGAITWWINGSIHCEAIMEILTRPVTTNQGTILAVYCPEMTIWDRLGTNSLRLSELDSIKNLSGGRQYLLSIWKPFILDCGRIELEKERGLWNRVSLGIEINVSTRMTLPEIIRGHETGEIVSVLVHADNTTRWDFRFIILHKVSMDSGERVWERLGNFIIPKDLFDIKNYSLPEDALKILPVRAFGEVVIIS